MLKSEMTSESIAMLQCPSPETYVSNPEPCLGRERACIEGCAHVEDRLRVFKTLVAGLQERLQSVGGHQQVRLCPHRVISKPSQCQHCP